MAVGDIESVKKALAAVLSNAASAFDQYGTPVFFNATLDAVNAEKNDGHTTPYPHSVYPYERATLESYPAVELQGLTTTYDGQEAIKHATHRVAIVWTVVGDSEADITTDVERLVRTTRDLCWRSVLSGDLGLAPITVESDDYGALAMGPNQPFVKGGRVIVAIQALST